MCGDLTMWLGLADGLAARRSRYLGLYFPNRSARPRTLNGVTDTAAERGPDSACSDHSGTDIERRELENGTSLSEVYF